MNKKDFAIIFTVKNANPNGDPLDGNKPRKDFEGIGEVSDVCIKRKLRNRLLDAGQEIFVQSDDKTVDGYRSLKERADAVPALKKGKVDSDTYKKVACETWLDVRAFGQVFSFKGDSSSKTDSVSVGVRGAVAIQPAFSVNQIDVISSQITKSVNLITQDKRSSDTMGMKHRVKFGVYVCYGSINSQLAQQTGLSEKDVDLIKNAMLSMFENDTSSARPEGSMEVNKVYWWEHNSQMGQYSSAKVHRSLKVTTDVVDPKSFDDFEIICEELEGLKVEVLEGY